MGKFRRVLKQVCLLHKGELGFLRGENERLEAERDEWREKANSGSITINSQGVSHPGTQLESGGEMSDIAHPPHYQAKNDPQGIYECINVIEAWDLGFCLGNALKYISRAGRKPGEDATRDLGKAVWYLQREMGINRLNGSNWCSETATMVAAQSQQWKDKFVLADAEREGLEMAVAILTADRDNLKEAKAKVEYEAQNFAKDRDAWKEAYDVLKVDCGPIELTRLPDRCEDCEWKELAEKRSAEIAGLEKASRLETKRAIERAEAIETELATRAQQFREEKRELSISIEDLKDKLTAAINDLQATRTECTCHTEDNQYYECPVCEIRRVRGEAESLQKSLAMAHETIRAQVEMIRAKAERADFLESELDRFDALGIERLKAEMDKANRLKAELEDVRAAFISVTGYKDRVRAAVGQLAKVASSE